MHLCPAYGAISFCKICENDTKRILSLPRCVRRKQALQGWNLPEVAQRERRMTLGSGCKAIRAFFIYTTSGFASPLRKSNLRQPCQRSGVPSDIHIHLSYSSSISIHLYYRLLCRFKGAKTLSYSGWIMAENGSVELQIQPHGAAVALGLMSSAQGFRQGQGERGREFGGGAT